MRKTFTTFDKTALLHMKPEALNKLKLKSIKTASGIVNFETPVSFYTKITPSTYNFYIGNPTYETLTFTKVLEVVWEVDYLTFSNLNVGDVFVFENSPNYEKVFLGETIDMWITFDIGEKKVVTFYKKVVEHDSLLLLKEAPKLEVLGY